jgi:hypothetical protein
VKALGDARRGKRRCRRSHYPVNFERINRAALAGLPALLHRWLPDGRIEGNEYVALNPRRHDRRPGSFSMNIRSGKWADFATDTKGGDIVSLAAFLADVSQVEAALRLAAMLGIDTGRDHAAS